MMMMNTKMSSKPLVVLDAPPRQPQSPGQYDSKIILKSLLKKLIIGQTILLLLML